MSEQTWEPQAVDSAVERVTKSLEVLVIDTLQPGMRLPSEGDLASEYGVSRLTVREALKVLAGRGLVELSRGRRPVVREPDSSMLSGYFMVAIRRDPRALLELSEVRLALEVQAATLAARQAGRAALTAVDSALQGMVDAAAGDQLHDVAAYHESDVAFHEALALASGNRMLAFILEGLADSLRCCFEFSLKGHRARGRSVKEVLDAHRLIVEKVREGDASGAAQAMRRHLLDAQRDLTAALRGDFA